MNNVIWTPTEMKDLMEFINQHITLCYKKTQIKEMITQHAISSENENTEIEESSSDSDTIKYSGEGDDDA